MSSVPESSNSRTTVFYSQSASRQKREEELVQRASRSILSSMAKARTAEAQQTLNDFTKSILIDFPRKISRLLEIISQDDDYSWNLFEAESSYSIKDDETNTMIIKPNGTNSFIVEDIFNENGKESYRYEAEVTIDHDQELGFIQDLCFKGQREFHFHTQDLVSTKTTPETIFTLVLNPHGKDMYSSNL